MKINFVIKKILTQEIKTGRLRVCDKMNGVPLFCECLSKFCCHHSASAEGWVTNNTNIDTIHPENSILWKGGLQIT